MKRNVFTIAVLVAGFAACSFAYGEEDQGEAPRGQKVPILDVGYEFTYFYYEETEGGYWWLMDESGVLHGVKAMATYLPGMLMLRGELHYWTGELEYDGQTQGGRPLTADTEDTLLDMRGIIGLDLRSESTNDTAILFTGVGLRNWNNTILGPGGYEREIEQIYMPVIGIDLSRRTSRKGAWGMRGEVDVLLKGTVTSHLSDLSTTYEDAENEQKAGTGFGLRYSFYYRFPVGESVAISLEPFIGWWHVAESETAEVRLGSRTETVVEPDNDTITIGLGASVTW